MYKPIFTCIAATLVAAPMTTIVKAEETTIIKRDRDGEADKTVIEKREELKVLPVPHKEEKTTRLTQRHLISRKNAWATSWLGLNRPSICLNPGQPPKSEVRANRRPDVALEANGRAKGRRRRMGRPAWSEALRRRPPAARLVSASTRR
jgi:hypothetical protein